MAASRPSPGDGLDDEDDQNREGGAQFVLRTMHTSSPTGDAIRVWRGHRVVDDDVCICGIA